MVQSEINLFSKKNVLFSCSIYFDLRNSGKCMFECIVLLVANLS